VFVECTDGQWNNLSRASAIKVEPHANPTKKGWVVLAFYSGRAQVLREFPTEREARDWLAETLEFADLAARDD
jgi:hypothetical protein